MATHAETAARIVLEELGVPTPVRTMATPTVHGLPVSRIDGIGPHWMTAVLRIRVAVQAGFTTFRWIFIAIERGQMGVVTHAAGPLVHYRVNVTGRTSDCDLIHVALPTDVALIAWHQIVPGRRVRGVADRARFSCGQWSMGHADLEVLAHAGMTLPTEAGLRFNQLGLTGHVAVRTVAVYVWPVPVVVRQRRYIRGVWRMTRSAVGFRHREASMLALQHAGIRVVAFGADHACFSPQAHGGQATMGVVTAETIAVFEGCVDHRSLAQLLQVLVAGPAQITLLHGGQLLLRRGMGQVAGIAFTIANRRVSQRGIRSQISEIVALDAGFHRQIRGQEVFTPTGVGIVTRGAFAALERRVDDLPIAQILG